MAKKAAGKGLLVSARVFTKFIPYIGPLLEIAFVSWDYCDAVVDNFSVTSGSKWAECWKVTSEGMQIAGGDLFAMRAKQKEMWAHCQCDKMQCAHLQ